MDCISQSFEAMTPQGDVRHSTSKEEGGLDFEAYVIFQILFRIKYTFHPSDLTKILLGPCFKLKQFSHSV